MADFIEEYHPIIQILFKVGIILLLVIHTRKILLTMLFFVLGFLWMYPDIKKLVITIMEAAK